MPVSCSSSAFTGSDGSLFYTPAATKFCLLDYTDFPAGDKITVPAKHDFRVGDPVVFTEEDGGSIDTGLTAGDAYFVVAVTATTISVSATKGGTAVTLGGDGGTGSGDTPGGHIGIKYDPFGAICQAREWSLTIEREQLEVTTLPCGVGAGNATGTKYAKFRKFQAGYATGSGTMIVYFTDSDDALGQRMLDNVMLSDQNGARVRLFIDTEGDGSGGLDLNGSMYIEADIMLESMNVGVNPDDPTQAEIGFTISDCTHLFKTAIA